MFAFTLIELLVVISIIGVLATLLLANFNSTRARARDAQRKSDLKNIQTALRLYYNDCGKYPSSSSSYEINGCGSCSSESTCLWGGTFTSGDASTVYMSELPNDPIANSDADRVYRYTRTDNDTYQLQACFENSSDDKCDPSGNTCWDGTNDCQYTLSP